MEKILPAPLQGDRSSHVSRWALTGSTCHLSKRQNPRKPTREFGPQPCSLAWKTSRSVRLEVLCLLPCSVSLACSSAHARLSWGQGPIPSVAALGDLLQPEMLLHLELSQECFFLQSLPNLSSSGHKDAQRSGSSKKHQCCFLKGPLGAFSTPAHVFLGSLGALQLIFKSLGKDSLRVQETGHF